MDFETAAVQLPGDLSQQHSLPAFVSTARECLTSFQSWLAANGQEYSPELAEIWLKGLPLSRDRMIQYRCVLYRLKDMVRPGAVVADLFFKEQTAKEILKGELLDAALQYFSSGGWGTCKDRSREACLQFMIFVNVLGLNSPADITYDVMITFYYVYYHHIQTEKFSSGIDSIELMLKYLFEKGYVSFGFTMIQRLLDLQKGLFWNDISEEALQAAEQSASSAEGSCCMDVLLGIRGKLEAYLRSRGYSQTNRCNMMQAFDCLYLFLDTRGWKYSPATARAWAGGRTLPDARRTATFRVISIIEQNYLQEPESELSVSKRYLPTPSRFSQLPGWCLEAASSYVSECEKNGAQRSTLDMIRSSIIRFCNFMDSAGIRSYSEITAENIKNFNASDKHSTPAGKNAYNSRIRKFLMYLGEKGLLSNPMIFTALRTTSAPKETIVVVLTEEEMSSLQEAIDADDGDLTLRQKAMLLLGLKMGMRQSDVVKLKYDDINWETSSIRFIQQKTQVEVNLPMPTEVGNALFRYIMEERPANSEPSVFLSGNAPHRGVNPGACQRALKKALPDRHVEGSGFHVLRRTYATTLLRGNVSAETVAEALGQRGTASVHRYLSLDEERMRMCPLPLEYFGLGEWSCEQ